MMRLVSFRVTDFRSVRDSGWVDTDSVTALIGTNEAGKTNLLMPLWKLNPAKDGQIDPKKDYPRNQFHEIRAMEDKPVFIRARFELTKDLASKVAALTGVTPEEVRIVEVSRDFDGQRGVTYPNAKPLRALPTSEVSKCLERAAQDVEALTPAAKAEEPLKTQMLSALTQARGNLCAMGNMASRAAILEAKKTLEGVDTEAASKRSTLGPRYGQALDELDELAKQVSRPHPQQNAEARKLILDNLPAFVYYSNYGNLDSEIYLPHAIQNMKRTDLGSREEAKVRTLKVLFEYVNLQPQEIMELGQEIDPRQNAPTPEQIHETAERKKEREILLTSASTSLTRRFREWWKQGEYRFRFDADGNHFRIWVSDDKRPEEIELEGRSAGLQWFLSFFLIFLVESQDAHADCILLLDEPGHSLHPIAQQDLFRFFHGLAETNQLIYTTHSPFLVDPDHLDRVRAVYVDDDGTTAVSEDLRARENKPAQSKSIYPVHAALGLSVSDTLLLGCQPVIVEGQSDQYYLSGIKNFLIAKGLITPQRELVFMPAGGVKGIGALTAIITGIDERLPFVLLDSDGPGKALRDKLASGLYAGSEDRLLMFGDLCGMEGAEVEDLYPGSFLVKVLDRTFRGPDADFSEGWDETKPILPQVEAYAAAHGIALEKGWKVEIAKQAKTRLLRLVNPLKGEETVMKRWTDLFQKFDP